MRVSLKAPRAYSFNLLVLCHTLNRRCSGVLRSIHYTGPEIVCHVGLRMLDKCALVMPLCQLGGLL